jgi:ATP/maltotriose-dependent transcriptional regulator MalT
MFVATSTVRTHVKNIYGKLGVHKRWDAVQRAEELGFL